MTRICLPAWLAILTLAAFAGGCRKDEDVRVYTIDKDDVEQNEFVPGEDRMRMPADHPPVDGNAQLPSWHPDISDATGRRDGAPAEVAGIRWKTPPGWETLELTRREKVALDAKLSAPAGEGKRLAVSISRQVGSPQSLLMNVNRWHGQQLGLGELGPAKLQGVLDSIRTPAGACMIFDKSSAESAPRPGTRMLVALFLRDGTLWIVKAWDDAKLIGPFRDDFLRFVNSIRFGPPPATQPGTATQPSAATQPGERT